MLTPNRNGLSPMPGDIFYSQDVDTNYQMGLTWGRTTQFRFIAHATDAFTAGVSLENPEQYTGSAVVLPAAFTAPKSTRARAAARSDRPARRRTCIPTSSARSRSTRRRASTHQHIDAAVARLRLQDLQPGEQHDLHRHRQRASRSTSCSSRSRTFRLVATNFFSKGGGRYIANTNMPDFIVNPDFSLSRRSSRGPASTAPEVTGDEDAAVRLLQPGAGRPNVTRRRQRHDADRLRHHRIADRQSQDPGGHGRHHADLLPRSRRSAACS